MFESRKRHHLSKATLDRVRRRAERKAAFRMAAAWVGGGEGAAFGSVSLTAAPWTVRTVIADPTYGREYRDEGAVARRARRGIWE